jgi:type I restriction enzyme M protein
MLDATTKRKIDSARQILVGKVPDPKAQVEQITTALVYKFMDDMDKESQELGGEAKFFTNGFEKYSWTKLLDKRLSGQERLDLYVQAITNMSKNPHIPQLFRDIFKDAFLPYRDPATLSLFLKEINNFTYDHSENLGNAFEYLLSALGSQGEAGQFRTPRHIIEFIVSVVDPKKDETILDPACGTAGFLISAYKHILKNNSSSYVNNSDLVHKGDSAGETVIGGKEKYSGDLLTPEEKREVMNHIVGYDISPDMVKLSLVNMYLHGFPTPNIYEYDTLTSEKRWDENFDVIMANPPFMTPKGGIRPHKRFFVQSSRAEVLFVDYILEHLNLRGRGGVVVPEGVLENFGKDFVKLRKALVDYGLYAIVSLPVGTFQPYSANIKTSILFFDRSITKTISKILYFRLEHDGFDLGKNRKAIKDNDLPVAKDIIKKFYESIKAGRKYLPNNDKVFLFDKSEVVKSPEVSLNVKSYKQPLIEHEWPLIEIGKLFKVEKGSLQSTKNKPGKYNFITASEEWKTHETFSHDCEAIIFAMGASGSLGRTHYVNGKFISSDLCFILTPSEEYIGRIDLRFYNNYFTFMRDKVVKDLARGAAKKAISQRNFKRYKLPYPPISIQKEIMKKVDDLKQKISSEEQIILEHKKKIENYKEEIRNRILHTPNKKNKS